MDLSSITPGKNEKTFPSLRRVFLGDLVFREREKCNCSCETKETEAILFIISNCFHPSHCSANRRHRNVLMSRRFFCRKTRNFDRKNTKKTIESGEITF